jgi:hypothetical protein
MAALPLPVVYQLRMKSGQRWAVISLLCLGSLVAVVGSVRTYYVWFLFSNDDLTWYAGPHWICSEVEICVAMVSSILITTLLLTNDLDRSAPAHLRCDLSLDTLLTVSEPSLTRKRDLHRQNIVFQLSRVAAVAATIWTPNYQHMPHKQSYCSLGPSILKVSPSMASVIPSLSLLVILRPRNGN